MKAIFPMQFDPEKIRETGNTLRSVAFRFQDTALQLRAQLDAENKIPTAQEAEWLEFLLKYSRAANFYAEEASRIANV